MNVAAQQLATTACKSLGYAPDSRKAKVAELATEITLGKWPAKFGATTDGWSQHEFEKQRRQEAKQLRKTVYREAAKTIKADPRAYGFDPITVWFLGILISAIIQAVVRFLIERWWSASSEIQAARAGS